MTILSAVLTSMPGIRVFGWRKFARTFAHLSAGDFDIAPLVTRTVGLDEVGDAFARLRTDPHDAKIVLDPTVDAVAAVPPGS